MSEIYSKSGVNKHLIDNSEVLYSEFNAKSSLQNRFLKYFFFKNGHNNAISAFSTSCSHLIHENTSSCHESLSFGVFFAISFVAPFVPEANNLAYSVV